ncbi:MAG: AAA family ATPase [Syntrophales bacterium LBB04]|nr:AAA family ATPase [Syntrophales bacterium LBB04]
MNMIRRMMGRFNSTSNARIDTKWGIDSAGAGSNGNGRPGWVSPVYCHSTRVHLSTGRMVENRCVAVLPGAPELEHYRMLRTQIQQRTEGKSGCTVMVTSALPGEGKTLTSINLAFTFAKDFEQTVLLVDCDLRQQKVHEYLGIPGGKGIIDFLTNGTTLNELIVWPGIEKITLISGGRSFAESAEMLGSPRMRELVMDLKKRYPERYVFFDVPPVLTGADAAAFAPLVDWILVVVESGRTAVSDINRALELLPAEKVLGLVLNRQHETRRKGYEPYGSA